MTIRVSVAMAVFNGEKYLRSQIDSIIGQLGSNDELIISYNKSSDNTWNIINTYAEKIKNIKIYTCLNTGVIANFNNAIKNCNGKYIFLADQDDIWSQDKIETVVSAFENSSAITILHNTEIVKTDLEKTGQSLFELRNAKAGIVKNILKNSYQGCCMAFKAELVPYIYPIPLNVPMHDQYIGLISERIGKVILINEKLILYRRHNTNASSDKSNLLTKIINRWRITKRILKRPI